MFTGLISDVGEILSVETNGDLRARIGCDYDVSGIELGASIACDGVCLTAIATGADPRPWFDVEISAETGARTTMAQRPWAVGQRVNLERSLRVGDEMGGHMVSGHVDGVAQIVAMAQEGDSTRYSLEAPAELARFIAPKGSVALNGTSLTVNEVEGARFGVNLIPHTKEVTTWGRAQVGDAVNIEIDTIARYVARYAERLQSFDDAASS
ncbi:riboflavin synthase [Palleronia caenipelagi]|uniref:Riboflavin synthase n=1 Tax=Palleronia caenipelagi TaxID=2489174 RepID=A0A547Q5E5_9RHOB|nr:riboflavin synthase [Palleronia caenipelagi]TRD21588.1 riboflavin synthase [Palleronia caenipelagi]